jgi:hypothetical protein
VIDGLTSPHLFVQKPANAKSRQLDKQKPKRVSKTISVQFSLGCEPSAKGRSGDSIGQGCIQDYKEGSRENSLKLKAPQLEGTGTHGLRGNTAHGRKRAGPPVAQKMTLSW